MSKSIRFFIALIVFTISLALLAWSFWPAPRVTRVLSIPPAELTLPTPGG